MDFQIILVDTIHFNGLDADVAADAVDFVDDVIAGLEVRKDVDFLAFGGMMAQARFWVPKTSRSATTTILA